MLRDHVLSTTVVAQAFAPPRDIPPQPLIAYDWGGVALNDATKGLQVKVWRCRWVDGDFIVDAAGIPDTVLFSATQVTELDFTFDQNMQPFIAYVQNGVPKYRWYDATVTNFVVVSMASDVVTPRCALDDKRALQGSVSDIILAYVRSGSLYYREQRDRFTVEYLLKASAGSALRRVGMGLNWRFLFEMEG